MNPITYPRDLRFHWYLQVEKHRQSVREVCVIFGISRKTYYKWFALDHGGHPLHHQSPRPQPALKVTAEVSALIEREKQLTNYGPRKMQLLLKRRLGLAVSTTVIYRYYLRRHLIRRPQKRLPWYQPLTNPVIPRRPGEVVQIDTKYVWQEGRRQYQRTFVDVFTGLQHAVVVPSLEAQATIKAFQAAEQVLPFPMLGVQTDNGSENRGVFHQYLGERGIAHYFIPKNSPNWNGAVERAHGVIDQEFYHNPRRPWQTMLEYLHWYNHERIHLGKYLNGLTPMEKYHQYLTQQAKVSPLTVN